MDIATFYPGDQVRGMFYRVPYTGTVVRVVDHGDWQAVHVDFDVPVTDGEQIYEGGVIFVDFAGNPQQPMLSTIEAV